VKIIHHLSCGVGKENLDYKRAFCKRQGIPEDNVNSQFLFVTLPVDDPRIDLVNELAAACNESLHCRIEYQYTAKELASFEFLVARYVGQEIDDSDLGDLKNWDVSDACQSCFTGIRPVAPVKVQFKQRKSLPAFFSTYWRGLFLHGDIVREIIELMSTQDGLLACQIEGNFRGEDYFCIAPKYVMPRFDEHTIGIEKNDPPGCSQCGRDGCFHSNEVPFEPHYPKDAFPRDVAFASSWEHFGISGKEEPFSESSRATPEILIAQDVYRVLNKHKVRRLRVHPVRFGD